MSDMVERLAKRWAYSSGRSHDGDIHGTPLDVLAQPDTRWWLNAIADELERRDTPLPLVRREMVIFYLREEARDEGD